MTTTAEDTWTFSLVLDGLHEPTARVEDALFEAGCDDALLAFSNGVATLEFDRLAPSFRDAVFTAIADVERAGLDVTVLRVVPDDFVNASDIAKRAGVSREAVRKWVEGERGGGEFPAPRANVGASVVWSWFEVAGWLRRREQLDEATFDIARFTAALNQVFDTKRLQGLVEDQVVLEAELEKLRQHRT